MLRALSPLSSVLLAATAGRTHLRVDVEAIADDAARVALDEYFRTLLTLARRQHHAVTSTPIASAA